MPDYIDVFDVDYSIFANIEPQTRKQGQRVKYGQPKAYADTICAFDIETSRIKAIDQSIMYIWQFAIKGYPCIIGRNWEEFLFFLKKVNSVMKEDLRLVCFVHNLSYEFSYLAGIYDFKEWEVFATDNRKVLYCRMFNRFEFRCSYKLTNTNLKTFLKDYGAEHQKVSGDEFNYDLVRYPWTELSDFEMQYCVNDVVGLVEAIENLMKAENDNYYSLPYTSTGYVRRDVKQAMINETLAQDTYPDWETYQMLKWAFRGGDTHCNRWYAGKILDNVKTVDRSSSYPDVMINEKFPVSAFEDYDPRKLEEQITAGKACLVHLLLTGPKKGQPLKLRNSFCGNPYIPFAKCQNVEDAVIDNGRIISAMSLEICCTDIDYQIMKEQYSFKAHVITLKIANYGDLPKAFKDVILDLYKKKTELKGVEGKEIEYALSKNKINSCYGMCVQDPVKEMIKYRNGAFVIDDSRAPKDILESAKKRAFLPYCVGVWVTSLARKKLYDGTKIVGQYNFVYCDTDSVKYLGEADFTEFNNKCIENDLKSGAYATDSKGVVHYMGVYESEPEYPRFCSIGSKKYAWENADGSLGITIAGVNKAKGGDELKRLGGLEAFAGAIDYTKEITFKDAGGLDALYNDIAVPYTYITDEGWVVTITSNCCLRPSTYTLGITQDYKDILEMCENDLKRLPVL